VPHKCAEHTQVGFADHRKEEEIIKIKSVSWLRCKRKGGQVSTSHLLYARMLVKLDNATLVVYMK